MGEVTYSEALGILADGGRARFNPSPPPAKLSQRFFDVGEQLALRRGELLLIEHAPTVELRKALKIADERSPSV